MIYTGCISKNDFTNFQLSSAHQNKKKSSYQCMLHTFSFRGTASTFAQPQSCRFLSMGTVQFVVYSSLIQHEETQYQLTLGTCQTFVTVPGPVTACDSLSYPMAECALVQVEDAYELNFTPFLIVCVFTPNHTQLHCTALHVYVS